MPFGFEHTLRQRPLRIDDKRVERERATGAWIAAQPHAHHVLDLESCEFCKTACLGRGEFDHMLRVAPAEG